MPAAFYAATLGEKARASFACIRKYADFDQILILSFLATIRAVTTTANCRKELQSFQSIFRAKDSLLGKISIFLSQPPCWGAKCSIAQAAEDRSGVCNRKF